MKFIKAEVDPKQGFCSVTISRKGNLFTGHAFYHPDEKTPFGEKFGCRIAEIRANIKYLKHRIEINRIRRQTLEGFKKDLENTLELKPNPILEKLNQHIEYYKKEIEYNKRDIRLAENTIQEDIKTRSHLFNKVNKK